MKKSTKQTVKEKITKLKSRRKSMQTEIKSEINEAGEALRLKFFIANPSKGEIGGFNACHWAEGVQEMKNEYMEWDNEDDEGAIPYFCGKKDDVICKWAFDRNADLQFHLPDGKVLRNEDSKTPNKWKMYSAEEWKAYVLSNKKAAKAGVRPLEPF